MPRKDLLDIESLNREEIEHLLEQSIPFKELFTRSVKKVPALKGKSVLMLFYEPSTRTHSSFEVAAKRLSADVTNFDVGQSSITKGESVRETIETLQAMRTDYVIVRHKASGLPGTIARLTKASVINAGDGAHAHPTQALLDAFTIKEKFPDPTGKKGPHHRRHPALPRRPLDDDDPEKTRPPGRPPRPRLPRPALL